MLSSPNGLTTVLGLLVVGPINSHYASTNYFWTQVVIVSKKHSPQHFPWVYAPVSKHTTIEVHFSAPALKWFWVLNCSHNEDSSTITKIQIDIGDSRTHNSLVDITESRDIKKIGLFFRDLAFLVVNLAFYVTEHLATLAPRRTCLLRRQSVEIRFHFNVVAD